MTMNIPSQREFSSLFRQEFQYVEDKVDLPPLSPLLSTFYESVALVPWERSCGYWNVFLNFDAYWDIRDHWFILRLLQNDRKRPSPGNEAPAIPIDWILDALNPIWRAEWPEVDDNDGVQLVKLYAAAVKPYAREIFIPAVRPSEDLEGFSWWPKVEPRLQQAS